MAISSSPACDSDPGHLTTPVHLPIDEVAIGAVVAGVEGAEPLALPVGGHSAANLGSLILSYQSPLFIPCLCRPKPTESSGHRRWQT